MDQGYLQAKQKTTNILQVLPSLKSGGVERGTVDIARVIAKTEGMKSFVASSGGPMVEQLEREGSRHFRLPLDRKNPFVAIGNIGKLVKIIRKYEIDLVHARSRMPAWSAYFAAKWCGVPFLTTFHGVYKCGNPFKKLYNSVMTRGKLVISISDFVTNHIQRTYHVKSSRIRLIHRGTDMDYFSAEKVTQEEIDDMRWRLSLFEPWPIIFVPGRFTRWKGQHIVMEALAQLPKNLKYYCVFSGDLSKHPDYVTELEAFTREHQWHESVRMVDAISDVRVVYHLADLVVAPSIEPEAFGRIPVEAAAMECPVIVTNIGGFKETMIHEKTGYLINPNDADALSEVIQKVLKKSPRVRAAMGKAARKHVMEHFSLQQMQQKTMAVYREMLGLPEPEVVKVKVTPKKPASPKKPSAAKPKKKAA